MAKQALLCGDPQQPSEYMREGAAALADRGVTFETMEWRGGLDAAAFRDVTMDMEERGPDDYDAGDIVAALEAHDPEILVVHKAPVGRAVFEAGEGLEIAAAARGGTENVDADAAAERGVTVLHAPGRNADAVSDYAVGFALAAHRRIPYFARTTAAGEWALEFDPEGLPRDVSSLTVGIVGFGNVGRRVAARWNGFDADVLAHDPYVGDAAIRDGGARPVSLDDVLAGSDVVSLHVRLSEETRGLIDADALDRMGGDALLVNTARGGLVEEEALATALREGAIGGAALDVFREEPLPADHPLLDLAADGDGDVGDLLLSPHTAGSTRDAVLNGSRIVARDVAALLDGEEPRHRIV
jgi:D-3-phosphoglycerate dehydrogenase